MKDNPISRQMAEWAKLRPTTDRVIEAAQENGKLGGRPRAYPPCSKMYGGKPAHRFVNDRCPCGFERPATYKRPARKDKYKRRIKGLAPVFKPVKVKPAPVPGAKPQAPEQAVALTGEWMMVNGQLVFRR